MTPKFRGQDGDSGEWVYGWLFMHDGYAYIIPISNSFKPTPASFAHSYVAVDPATVGQFTGLHDKDGKEIYAGDVIEGNLFDERLPTMGQVVYDSMHACFANKNDGGETPLSRIASTRVIGNLHDNPELLEKP